MSVKLTGMENLFTNGEIDMVKEVKIGCYDYTVEEVECVNKYTPRMGEIEYIKHAIRVDKDLPVTRKKEALLHEIVHGIDEFMRIGLEEEQVNQLGGGLVMVLRDNPELAKLFVSEVREEATAS